MGERLEGTVALVTGASSGIGLATAVAMARQGAAVALVARRRDRLDELAGRIRDDGGTALAVEADVTCEWEATAAVERTVAEFGRLDTLVNNAGAMLLGPVVDAPLAEWDRMIAVNITGALHCVHAAMPHLLCAASTGPRGVADLVNVTSTAGRFPRRGAAVYNATKHALTGFSEALRQEVTRRHVRVSLVEPGATDTELTSHVRPEVWETMQHHLDAMELLHAEDVADAIEYVVTRPRRMAVNEILVRPTEQEG